MPVLLFDEQRTTVRTYTNAIWFHPPATNQSWSRAYCDHVTQHETTNREVNQILLREKDRFRAKSVSNSYTYSSWLLVMHHLWLWLDDRQSASFTSISYRKANNSSVDRSVHFFWFYVYFRNNLCYFYPAYLFSASHLYVVNFPELWTKLCPADQRCPDQISHDT